MGKMLITLMKGSVHCIMLIQIFTEIDQNPIARKTLSRSRPANDNQTFQRKENKDIRGMLTVILKGGMHLQPLGNKGTLSDSNCTLKPEAPIEGLANCKQGDLLLHSSGRR